VEFCGEGLVFGRHMAQCYREARK